MPQELSCPGAGLDDFIYEDDADGGYDDFM
jgi:hypothetical protein